MVLFKDSQIYGNMKRIVICTLTIFVLLSGFAQDRIIKMPEKPVQQINIAQEDDGYWCSIEFNGGSTLMEQMKNIALINLEFTNGYRFSQYLKVGAGIGVTYYPNNSNVRSRDKKLSMPLFLNVRGNILSDETRQSVPYWSFNVGTSLPDGFFMTPTIGLRIGEERSALLLGLSYTLRHFKSYPENISGYSGAMFKIGYEF